MKYYMKKISIGFFVFIILIIQESLVANAASCEANFEILTNYSTCEVKSNRPIYVTKADPKCGVKIQNFGADPACGNKYRACATPSNGVSFWTTTASGGVGPSDWRDGAGVESCQQDGVNEVASWNARRYGPNGDTLTPDQKFIFQGAGWEASEIRSPIGNILIRRSYYCKYRYDIMTATYYTMPNSACGTDGYQNCQFKPVEYRECADSSFGIKDYVLENRADKSCGTSQAAGNSAIILDDKSVPGSSGGTGLSTHNSSCGLCDEISDTNEKLICLGINYTIASNVNNVTDVTFVESKITTTKAMNLIAMSAGIILQKILNGYYSVLELSINWRNNQLDRNSSKVFLSAAINKVNKNAATDLLLELSKQLLFTLQTLVPGIDESLFWNFKFDPKSITSQQIFNFRNLIQSASPVFGANLATFQLNLLTVGNFYARMVNEYINQKTLEIAELKSIQKKIKLAEYNWKIHIDKVYKKVEKAQINKATKDSILSRLTAIHNSTSETKASLLGLLDRINTGLSRESDIMYNDNVQLFEFISGQNSISNINRSLLYLNKGLYGPSMSMLLTTMQNNKNNIRPEITELIKDQFKMIVQQRIKSSLNFISFLKHKESGTKPGALDMNRYLLSESINTHLIALIKEISADTQNDADNLEIQNLFIINLMQEQELTPLNQYRESLK